MGDHFDGAVSASFFLMSSAATFVYVREGGRACREGGGKVHAHLKIGVPRPMLWIDGLGSCQESQLTFWQDSMSILGGRGGD